MLDILDAPWVWPWLGGVGLLGLILGVAFGVWRGRRPRRVAAASADAAQAAARDAQSRTTALESELDDLRMQLSASEAEIEGMRSALDQAQTRAAELETETAALRRSSEAELEALRSEVGTAEQNIEGRLEAYAAALEDARRETDEARREAEEHAAELQRALGVARSETEAKEEARSRAASELEAATERIAALEDSLREARSGDGPDPGGEVAARDHLIAELRSRLDELEGVGDRLVAKEAEVVELQREVEAATSAREAEVTRLRQRLAAAERASAAIDQRDARIQELEEELNQTHSALDEAEESARRWEAEVAGLHRELTAPPEPHSTPTVSEAGVTPLAVPASGASTAVGAADDLEARLALAERRIAAQLEERIAEATARLEARLTHQRSVLEDKEARIAFLSGRVAALERTPPPPRDSDDLTLISGIGPAIQRMLNGVGVTTFEDVAALSGERLAEVRGLLGIYPHRIEDDEWIPQARALAARRDTSK